MPPPVDPLTLGLTLALLGMGGTLLTLYGLGLVASLLKRMFPLVREAPAEVKGEASPGGSTPGKG